MCDNTTPTKSQTSLSGICRYRLQTGRYSKRTVTHRSSSCRNPFPPFPGSSSYHQLPTMDEGCSTFPRELATIFRHLELSAPESISSSSSQTSQREVEDDASDSGNIETVGQQTEEPACQLFHVAEDSATEPFAPATTVSVGFSSPSVLNVESGEQREP